MLDLMEINNSAGAIKAKRAEIAGKLNLISANIKTNEIARIATLDLKLLFDLYDEVFFNGKFKDFYSGELKFSLSPRLTRSAGKTVCPKNIAKIPPEKAVMEIRIGLDFFFKYNEIHGVKMVCGIPTRNALEALQLVFEHELCHVLEFANFYTSNCGRQRFRTIAGNLFKHTESYHKLPTQRRITEEKYGFKIGGPVAFTVANKTYRGILYRINKRATVMVRDEGGAYTDKQGNRYTKYYVPVKLLHL